MRVTGRYRLLARLERVDSGITRLEILLLRTRAANTLRLGGAMTARRSTPSDKIIPVPPASSTTRNRFNISYERQDITAWVCTPPVSKSILHLTYWIIAIVPVTVLQNPNGNNAQTNSNPARQASTDVPYHPKYQGTVLFQNKFKGKLPAAEYPKVNVRGMVWPRFL